MSSASIGSDLAHRRIGRHRPRHSDRARQAGGRRADARPAPAARYLGSASSRWTKASLRASACPGHRRDRALGRCRGPAARAACARRRYLRVNGQPVTPDQTCPISSPQRGKFAHPARIIRVGKRQMINVSSFSVRPRSNGPARRPRRDDNPAPNGTPGAAAARARLSLAPLTPELARAANLRRGRAE